MNNKKQKVKIFSAIISSLLILIVSQLIAQLLASSLVLMKLPEYICNVLAGILYIIISYNLLRLLCLKYLKSEMEKYYISKFKINIKWLIIGLILPLLVVGIYLLLSGDFKIVNMEVTKKSILITGGEFGIESSIVALIGYSLVSLIGYYYLKNTKRIK